MDQDWKERTEKKLDRLFEINKNQDLVLLELKLNAEKNTEILDEHQKCSKSNSERLNLVEDQIMKYQNHMAGITSVGKAFMKFLGAASLILGIWYTAHRLF